MAASTPLLLASSEGLTIGLIDTVCPVGSSADSGIIDSIKGTKRAVAGVTSTGCDHGANFSSSANMAVGTF
jgi:hypothetical protein